MIIIKNDLQNYFYVKFMQYFQVMAGINHILKCWNTLAEVFKHNCFPATIEAL